MLHIFCRMRARRLRVPAPGARPGPGHIPPAAGRSHLRAGRATTMTTHDPRSSHVFYRKLTRRYPRIVRGEGCWLYDADGRPYLDAVGGAFVANVGHGVRRDRGGHRHARPSAWPT